MKYVLTLILALAFSFQGMSQSSLKNADRLFKTYYYVKASKAYSDYMNSAKGDISTQTLLNAADANYYIYNTFQAKQYYQRAFEKDSTLTEPYISRYVRTLRSEGDYEGAHSIYSNYLQKIGNQDSIRQNQKRYEEFLELLNDEEEPLYRLTNISSNSAYSDFAPVVYGDTLIFSSSRPGNAKSLYSWNDQPFLSLFKVAAKRDTIIGNVKVFSKATKSNYHDATVAFVPDTTTVYFTSSNINEKKKLILDDRRKNHFQLFKGNLINGVIENRDKVNFNSDFHSVSHPSVSKDGKYLFFASDMTGGFGGSDIYYSKILNDGSLSKPVNAGATINTSGNEFFPFLHEDVLYYSSNGLIGFGGQDIFSSEFNKDSSRFSQPMNLGKVVNTTYDDFSMIFMDDGLTGYMASNRENGVGDDDIYFFTKEPLPCFQMLAGNVIDKRTREILEDATVTLRDTANTVMSIVKTDSDGNYEVELPCSLEVTLTAEKENYFEEVKLGKTGDIDGEENEPINFELESAEDLIVVDEVTKQEKIDLDPIFFDFDKSDITEQAAEVLADAVKLMKFYPDMVIKIEAHTDSRGSDKYNFNLSDRRAKATQQYLFSQGIEEDRIISAQGYGERRLLNKCSDGVKCTEELHDVNRRSDFIILKR